MADPTSVLTQISKQFRRLVVATVVLYLVAAGGGAFVYSEADKTRDALCALRGDLKKRVENSEAFLRENPKGIPGIPAKTIQDGIRNQRRTIEALGTLDC